MTKEESKAKIRHRPEPKDNSAVEAEVVLEEPSLEPEVLEEGEEALPVILEEEEVSVENTTPAEDRVPTPTRSNIVPYNPLEAYLREIRAYPPLTKEEEIEFAIRYQNSKDIEAAYTLVTSNLWLVVKIARDYERAARSILDLIQEGNIGLMEAVKNFDPYRGVRFPSYAVWWIKAYIVRYLIANWRLVKIGTTQAQRKLFFNLKKEKEKLERDGFYPEPKLLADKLDVKESEVVEMEQRLGSPDISVDAPVMQDGDTTLLSVLPADNPTAEELLSEKQLKNILAQGLHEFSSTLKQKEVVIFKERMLSDEKATLQDMADKLSISRERVRQIENRVREKLKDFLLKKYGTLVENLDL